MAVWSKFAASVAATILLPALPQSAAAQPKAITADDYARAERVHEVKAPALVFRNRPSFHWSDDGKSLFYEINDKDGPRYERVDAATGARIKVEAFAAPKDVWTADMSPAPDGRSALFARDSDLWLRVLDGQERRLTSDGAPSFAYGALPDYLYKTIPRLKGELKLSPFGVQWSPDGRTLVGQRTDERKVKLYPFVAWAPADGSHRPKLYQSHLALPGDPDKPILAPFLLDVATGALRRITPLAGWRIDVSSAMWSARGDKAYLLAASDDAKGGALVELDVATGILRAVITERRDASFGFNDFIYSAPNVRLLGGGREAVWFSERDGAGNIYLYDLPSGRLKRQLTHGPGMTLDIVATDEGRRRLFITAEGRDPLADPYERHLYSVSLDDGGVIDLTPEHGDHEISGPTAPLFQIFFRPPAGAGAISPDGRRFVDSVSSLDHPPVISLRSAQTGAKIRELDRGDASALTALGWRPPLRVKVTAADGKTDIWGAVYLPPGYDGAKKYPVIDGIYAGPQVIVAPRTFNEGSGARAQMFDRSSLAMLGFIVVTIDARGTPGRSAAFHDASYGVFADPQLDDHVAALRQLAARFTGMDLNRVGVYGHSYGGYVSARAILRYPDVFKVSVSSAGPQAWEAFNDNMTPIFGAPRYADGTSVRPEPTAVPEAMKLMDNTTLAGRLQGKLMLVYGDIDENAPAGSTLALVDALTKADKHYDLMYLPNTTHAYGALNYFDKRLWDYFVENLMGASFPSDYKFGQDAGSR